MTENLRHAAESYARYLGQHLGDNLVSVVLYGSVARAEAGRDSDIDLLVICQDLPEGRFARLQRLEAEHTIPLYLDMIEDARLLYDREAFFAGVLERLRARLMALGAERRRRGRTRYWILKRDFTPGEVIEL